MALNENYMMLMCVHATCVSGYHMVDTTTFTCLPIFLHTCYNFRWLATSPKQTFLSLRQNLSIVNVPTKRAFPILSKKTYIINFGNVA